jgi:hypothetical protein
MSLTGYVAATPLRYVLNPALVTIGTGAGLRRFALRGAVGVTITPNLVMPEVDGVPQGVRGNAYLESTGISISFTTSDHDNEVLALLNHNSTPVVASGDTVWTPRPNFQLLPDTAYVTDLRVTALRTSNPVAYEQYHVPIALLTQPQPTYGQNREKLITLTFVGMAPASDPQGAVYTHGIYDNLPA